MGLSQSSVPGPEKYKLDHQWAITDKDRCENCEANILMLQ